MFAQNKFIMWSGGLAATLAFGYLFYWNMKVRASGEEYKIAYQPDGSYRQVERKSRWE